jgi:flagellar biosynthetic protein FliP
MQFLKQSLKFKILLKLFSGGLFCLLTINSLFADSVTLNLGDMGGGFIGRMIQLMILLTVISLAPAIIIMVTSFTRIVVVFSFLRHALGTQQSPPNMIMISLALFLTGFIMGPTLEKSYTQGLVPLMENKINEEQAFEKITDPLRQFMMKNVREKDLKLFINLAKIENISKPQDIPLRVLVPSFIISELRRAFEIGFLVFIPFLVIDMVVASVLMSMGMMMLPPSMIAMPFKIVFFVLVDGWQLICGSLVNSFSN